MFILFCLISLFNLSLDPSVNITVIGSLSSFFPQSFSRRLHLCTVKMRHSFSRFRIRDTRWSSIIIEIY